MFYAGNFFIAFKYGNNFMQVSDDFVYNGYRYTMKNEYLEGVGSVPFDPWLLTCNNYISTMNPVKREKVARWDESLKGLQDWNFWLRVVFGDEPKKDEEGNLIPIGKGHFLKSFHCNFPNWIWYSPFFRDEVMVKIWITSHSYKYLLLGRFV